MLERCIKCKRFYPYHYISRKYCRHCIKNIHNRHVAWDVLVGRLNEEMGKVHKYEEFLAEVYKMGNISNKMDFQTYKTKSVKYSNLYIKADEILLFMIKRP